MIPQSNLQILHHFAIIFHHFDGRIYSKHGQNIPIKGGWSIHLGSGDQRGDAFAKTLGRFSTFQQGFV